MLTSTEFMSSITAPTIFPPRDLVKRRLICIVLCPTIVQMSRSPVTISCHAVDGPSRYVIMYEVIDESLRKTYHDQQNVPQHLCYYLLDTLVVK